MLESQNSKTIKIMGLYISGLLLVFGALGALYTGEGWAVLDTLKMIVLSPSRMLTDYFEYGSLGAAFLNAGLCGFAAILPVILLRVEAGENVVTGYFLVIAHGFYGKNIFNIWLPALATALFLILEKKDLRKNIHLCMFASCFGPLMGELCFRYYDADFDYLNPTFERKGVIAAIVVALIIGYFFPKAMGKAKTFHLGFNLYNAGFAGGFLGFCFYAYFYLIPEKPLPSKMTIFNAVYESFGHSYPLFINAFFILMFGTLALAGWYLNDKSFNGFVQLSNRPYAQNLEDYGMAICLINIGFYGLSLLGIYDLIAFSAPGAGFTGPTTGVILAAMSFACVSQNPLNTLAIVLGFTCYSFFAYETVGIWTLSLQPTLNAIAFATGLCPIVRKYGNIWGVVAGFICAHICGYTTMIHGGFMIYNGGLSTGLVGVALAVLLEHKKFIDLGEVPDLEVTEDFSDVHMVGSLYSRRHSNARKQTKFAHSNFMKR